MKISILIEVVPLRLVEVIAEDTPLDVRGFGLPRMHRITNRESERPHEHGRGREHQYPFQEGCVRRGGVA
jgi:hypothetical protein